MSKGIPVNFQLGRFLKISLEKIIQKTPWLFLIGTSGGILGKTYRDFLEGNGDFSERIHEDFQKKLLEDPQNKPSQYSQKKFMEEIQQEILEK